MEHAKRPVPPEKTGDTKHEHRDHASAHQHGAGVVPKGYWQHYGIGGNYLAQDNKKAPDKEAPQVDDGMEVTYVDAEGAAKMTEQKKPIRIFIDGVYAARNEAIVQFEHALLGREYQKAMGSLGSLSGNVQQKVEAKLTDEIQGAITNVVKAADIDPGSALGVVGKAQGYEQKYVDAKQAGAKQGAEKKIVSAAWNANKNWYTWAVQDLEGLQDPEAVKQRCIEVKGLQIPNPKTICKRFLLLFEEALRESGAFTVNEMLGGKSRMEGIDGDATRAANDLEPEEP